MLLILFDQMHNGGLIVASQTSWRTAGTFGSTWLSDGKNRLTPFRAQRIRRNDEDHRMGTGSCPSPAPQPRAAAKPNGLCPKGLRSTGDGARHGAAATRRRDALRPVPGATRMCRRRRVDQGPRSPRRRRPPRTRCSGRSSNGLATADLRATAGTSTEHVLSARLLQPDGYREVEQARQHSPPRQYFYTDNDSAGTQLDSNRNYRVVFEPGQEPLRERLLVDDAVQRRALLPPQRPQAILTRYEEHELQPGRRRVVDAARRGSIPRPGERDELLPAPDRSFLPLHPRLLGPTTPPRRLLETPAILAIYSSSQGSFLGAMSAPPFETNIQESQISSLSRQVSRKLTHSFAANSVRSYCI